MKILLIEDNKDFADFVRYTYPDENISIVNTLRGALEWAEDNRAHLIFVDLGLPDSRGLNTLKALNHLNSPKIVMTGEPNISWEVAELGAVDYILKNSEGGSQELLERVGFNIEKYRPRVRRFEPGVFEELKACLAF